MKIVLLHIFLFAGLLISEVAFLGIIFPSFPAPLVIMSAVVVWTLLLGFQRAIFFTVPLTLLYDILLSGQIRPFSVYMVLVAYSVSFLSRRLVVEHQGLAAFFYAAIVAAAAGGYQLFLAILEHRSLFPLFPGLPYLSFIFVAFVAFWFTYSLLTRFTRYIELLRAESALFTR